ncbi:hypothetical protein ACIODW_06755 [Streptomyces sp. NPDC087897]|uniref:hypothetical protein n=1 Tax=Streptomyces sp. NPDC087897 TaxID=3365817 RepID=UPI0038145892
MLITGYGHGPVVAGEALVGQPGFWSCHLLGLCADGACGGRAEPEWFGGDGADVDALSEVLFDPERWPVFRVLTGGQGSEGGVVVVYRNLGDEFGVDYLRAGSASCGEVRLSWSELTRLADGPAFGGDGVREWAERFLLLLPCLGGVWEEEAVRGRTAAALRGVGVPEATVEVAAAHLLGHLERRASHDPGWRSPLGGR